MVLLAAINFESNEAKAYLAIGVGVMALIYLYIRPGMKKRSDPLEKAPFADLHQQRAVERQMQGLLVEMAEMARQITAQLDTRVEKLNHLIDQADQRLARLEGAHTRPDDAPLRQIADAFGGTAEPPPAARIATPEPRVSEIYALADAGLPPAEVARRLGQPLGEVELILALRPSPIAPRGEGLSLLH